MTVGGQNFGGATTVKFGTNPATAVTVVSSTQVQATSPAAATTGTVDVTVTTGQGTSVAGPGDLFTYSGAGTLTFTVNSTADVPDATPGDGICATATGLCTLRAAVMEADAQAGPVTIIVPPGTYLLTIPPDLVDAAATGDLNLTGNVTIAGSGPTATIIDANQLDRVVNVAKGAVATITGVTLRNGKLTATTLPQGFGGGIQNRGTLLLQDSTVSGNVAYDGGGVSAVNAGSLTNLKAVTVSGNIAQYGAGVEEFSGTINITNSLITQNYAYGYCAGVDEDGGYTINVLNSTISYNSATAVAGFPVTGNAEAGGACEDGGGTLTITGSTISHNHSDTQAGGVVEDGAGILTIRDTTISYNDAGESAGGVYLDGGGATLFDHVNIINNRSTGAYTSLTTSFLGSGGGITEDGGDQVTLIDSTIAGNTAGHGAGIYMNGGGTWSISGSTISGNIATALNNGRPEDGFGGGLMTVGGGPIAITNSTIANNSASGDGGGIMVYGVSGGHVRAEFSTISGNRAGSGASNLESQATTAGFGIFARADIVAGSPTNCLGVITSSGHNIDDGATCGFDLASTNPQLQPLAANGGPTQTVALAAASPAIDVAGACGAPTFDQRGAGRPFGAGCDLGAFEYNAGGTVTPPRDPTYASLVLADGAEYYYRLNDVQATTFGPESMAYVHRLYYQLANVTVGATGALLQDPDPSVKGNGTGPLVTGTAVFWTFYPPITGTVPRTVELWFKAATAGKSENLLCYGAGTGGAVDFCLDSVAGVIQFNGTPFINTRVDDGAWHHIVVTYDGVGALNLYIDGAAASSMTTSPLNTGTTTMQFGQHFATTPNNLTGYLDEVAFYGLVLTPAQVAAHYAAR